MSINFDSRLRSVQHIFQECNIQTTRRNNQTLVERGAAILQEEAEDPLGRVGSWKMKEKLALKGIHISRFVHLLDICSASHFTQHIATLFFHFGAQPILQAAQHNIQSLTSFIIVELPAQAQVKNGALMAMRSLLNKWVYPFGESSTSSVAENWACGLFPTPEM